jgi:hypothetical protein
VLAPAQALVEQDLVDATALHRDAFLLMQVGGQPVERPGGKRQPSVWGLVNAVAITVAVSSGV